MGGKLSLDLTCIISMEAILFLFGIIVGMVIPVGLMYAAGANNGK